MPHVKILSWSKTSTTMRWRRGCQVASKATWPSRMLMRKAAGTSPPAIPTEEEFTLLAIIGPADHRASKNTSWLLHDIRWCGFLLWFWLDYFFAVSFNQSELSLYEHNLNDFKSGIDKGIQSSCMNLLNHYCDSSIRPEEIRNVLRVELRCDSPAVAYAHMMLDRACGMNPLKSFITTLSHLLPWIALSLMIPILHTTIACWIGLENWNAATLLSPQGQQHQILSVHFHSWVRIQ
jgi:hypothetical protein